MKYFPHLRHTTSNIEYVEQLKIAFTSEESFLDFLNGMCTEIMNDIEQQKEAGRALALDHCCTKLLVDKESSALSEAASYS